MYRFVICVVFAGLNDYDTSAQDIFCCVTDRCSLFYVGSSDILHSRFSQHTNMMILMLKTKFLYKRYRRTQFHEFVVFDVYSYNTCI